MSLHVIDHPLLKHKMSIIRDKETSTTQFREVIKEITSLMTYEVTRGFDTELREIETPISKTNQPFLKGKKPVVVPILRAGLGMVDGMLEVMPNSRVGHIGLYRDEKTLEAIEYFIKLPKDLDKRNIIITDPMLATAGSACKAIELLKQRNAKNIKLVCLLASQLGVDKILSEHPDVDLYVVEIDSELNEKGYIVPGLGDAGDRLFGTK